MARDYQAMEAEFIADLKSRSGRSLGEWMAAIDATGLAERDQIIDWLHPQGFTFEHASWLERIHHNGGRPIYDGAIDERRPERPLVSKPPVKPKAAPTNVRPAPPPGAEPAGDLEPLLSRGKAFRMLAELLIRDARDALDGLTVAARGDLISFERPGQLAVLLVTAKELRLGLALGDHPCAPPLMRPKGLGAETSITHMHLLNDARQVDTPLIELLRLADRIVNSAS